MAGTPIVDYHFNVSQLMEVLSTGSDPLPDDESNKPIMFFEWSDSDPLQYNDIDWNSECVLFSLGTSCFKAESYLIPRFAQADVIRIWAIQGEPIKVMIKPKIFDD